MWRMFLINWEEGIKRVSSKIETFFEKFEIASDAGNNHH